ncbi:protein FAR1-RELATED SEQUENCE 5-like [Rhododendron vialii]|uniref:protein FAR1-RELATED SEQUENCE 5-like n=1 Tax=Rhododendron vialii TaxID=182163 RepID=UPI00265E2C28|nr:protein FAR1-RELATED SEQUENCE 5-like [Rhododendron vialii]
MEEPFEINDFEADEGLKAPPSGIFFETIEEARKYYEEYGRQNGFWIRTRTSCKGRSRSNEVTSMLFVCAKEGKYVAKIENDGVMEENDENEETDEDGKGIPRKRARSCSTVKCGCKAHLLIKYDKWSSKWKVTVFTDDRNHPLVTPSKRMRMKSNRHMPKAVKNLTEAFHKENLGISKVTSIFGGEHIGFDNRDCYNHLRNVRHRELDGGDAQSVLIYFRNRQAQNPQFFYAIQCDDNGRAVNFFWVDSRSRMAYHYFGDVVTFDTTYRTNNLSSHSRCLVHVVFDCDTVIQDDGARCQHGCDIGF